MSAAVLASAWALMVATVSSCSDSQQPNPDERDLHPLTYSAPSWSGRGIIAYGDRGSREIGGAWTFVDSLAGIWTFDVATHARRRVVPFGNYPSWSPDDRHVAFWHNYELWILDTENGATRPLETGAGLANPSKWSPCDSILIYASTEGAPYDYTIWSINPFTGARWSVAPGQGGLRDPVWFADCDSLLHRRYVAQNSIPVDGIYIMSQLALAPVFVVDSGDEEHSLGMSPDGRFISYSTGSGNGGDRLYLFDRQSVRLVVPNGIEGRDLAWEPGGERFVYVGRVSASVDGLNSELVIQEFDFLDAEVGK